MPPDVDSRPMEGTTKLEHSVLVESLDSGLTEGMLSLEPLEQSVLNTLLVARPTEGSTETKPPERSALVLQLDYGHLNWESLARPMVDVALDRRPMKGLAVPLPVESLGLAMVFQHHHEDTQFEFPQPESLRSTLSKPRRGPAEAPPDSSRV